MSKELERQKLIEASLEKKLSRFEVTKLLAMNNFSELKSGEADCYDVMLNSISRFNPRNKIIASSLIQGLSRTDANLALYDAKFRRMNEGEAEYYDDILSRIRYCGNFGKKIIKEEKITKISAEEIIMSGIKSELSSTEVNKKLTENGYPKMTDLQETDYRKRYNEFHNKRQGIIQHAFEDGKTVAEINSLLKENNLTVLSMVEEMNYQKEKERIVQKKRQNLIKECLEERLEIYQINIILSKNNFEKLSEQEEDKIRFQMDMAKQGKKKTTELSDQFRKLYREATKKFHPDRFTDETEKEKANKIMKELNEAKDKNDYFLLKEIVAKYSE